MNLSKRRIKISLLCLARFKWKETFSSSIIIGHSKCYYFTIQRLAHKWSIVFIVFKPFPCSIMVKFEPKPFLQRAEFDNHYTMLVYLFRRKIILLTDILFFPSLDKKRALKCRIKSLTQIESKEDTIPFYPFYFSVLNFWIWHKGCVNTHTHTRAQTCIAIQSWIGVVVAVGVCDYTDDYSLKESDDEKMEGGKKYFDKTHCQKKQLNVSRETDKGIT